MGFLAERLLCIRGNRLRFKRWCEPRGGAILVEFAAFQQFFQHHLARSWWFAGSWANLLASAKQESSGPRLLSLENGTQQLVANIWIDVIRLSYVSLSRHAE